MRLVVNGGRLMINGMNWGLYKPIGKEYSGNAEFWKKNQMTIIIGRLDTREMITFKKHGVNAN